MCRRNERKKSADEMTGCADKEGRCVFGFWEKVKT
jgi:hypothetical protein